MSRTFFAGLLAGTTMLTITIAHAQTQTPVRVVIPAPTVTTKPNPTPGLSFFLPEDRDAAQSFTDGGSYLNGVVGVSSGRLGGHGTDPVIRGQQQTQLNIINDGAMIHGGCPSRMDPPSSFADPESFDSITVLKGYQSVRYGAGGTGGTVLFDRNPASFTTNDISLQGNVNGHYESNGQIRGATTDVAAGNSVAQMRAIWSLSTGNNYQDGNGNQVRSAFSSENYALMPVWTPTADTTIKAGVELNRTDDVLYSGMMDAPEGSALTHRLSLQHNVHGDVLKSFSVKAYNSAVDHVMDNYSLRSSTGMKMRTPSESDTFGGSIVGELVTSNIPLSIGLDLQNNARDAWSYTGMAMQSTATTLASRLWPDTHIRQTGFFAEATPSLSPTTRLKLGGRYDYVSAESDGANTVYGSASPNSLYLAHYGKTADDVSEHNLGGLLRLEHDLTANTTFFAGLSRSVRTADATERYLASNSMTASMQRVGNPDIAPEKHHQLDMGISHQNSQWTGTLSSYIDYVTDYIMQDTAKGQSGILVSDGSTIYRNIDAHLMGLEAEGKYEFHPRWTVLGGAALTYGNNDTDHDALAQIPPFSGKLGLEYKESDWMFGSRLNFATRQDRIDDQTSRRDVRKTGGYGTVDVYGKVNVHPVEIRLGVSNLFDKNYAQHLNRSNIFDPTSVQINEPGRSFGIQLHAKF